MKTEIAVMIITGSLGDQAESIELFVRIFQKMKRAVEQWNVVYNTEFELSVNDTGLSAVMLGAPPMITLSRIKVGNVGTKHEVCLRPIAQRLDSHASNPLYKAFLIDQVKHKRHRIKIATFFAERELSERVKVYYNLEPDTLFEYEQDVYQHLRRILEALTG